MRRIERSKGKLRPGLVRSSDVGPVEAVPNPTAGRGAAGRFAAGNPIGQRARMKHAVKKVLGAKCGDETLDVIVSDGLRLYAAIMRELPSDGATVRQLVALQARHGALAGYYGAKAAEAGLDTPQGLAFDARAMQHGLRVERLACTVLDLAEAYAAPKPKADPVAALRARIAAHNPNEAP